MPIDISREFDLQQGVGKAHAGVVDGEIRSTFLLETVDGRIPYLTLPCLKVAVKEMTAVEKDAKAAMDAGEHLEPDDGEGDNAEDND